MTLDLNGVKHYQIEIKVETFILMNQNNFPLTIDCGNNIKAVELVNKVTKKLNCETMYFNGKIFVRKFN